MKKIITGILIIMLSAATSHAVYAKAVGKFVKVEGRVDITRPGKPAILVKVGTEIFEKDIIRSKSNSKAEIHFVDGNVLRLAQKTRVEVSEYISDSGNRSTILNLFRGKIQNKVKKMFGGIFGRDKNRYEVHTPTSVCGVRGTDFFISYHRGVSQATFKEGFGYGYNRNQPDNVIEVQAGQSMVVSGSNAPPAVRTSSQGEINQLEGETTPADEGEESDEDDNSEDVDNSSGEEESINEEEGAEEDSVAEESDSEEVDEETSDAADEGSATEDSGQPSGDAAEGPQEAGDSSTTDDSGFVSVDSVASGGVDDGGTGEFDTGDDFTDTVFEDNPAEDSSQIENVVLQDNVDTTNTNEKSQDDYIEEAIENTTMSISSGKLMGTTPGVHYEGEYILPRSTDPFKTCYYGPIEAGRYKYDYFLADDGSYLRGFSEEETTDEVTGDKTWIINDYLPDGTLFTETGIEDGTYTEPTITEGTWDQTTITSIATPPAGYYERYTGDFIVSMITGVGEFEGEIQVPSDLWTTTQDAPVDIELSGQYTYTSTDVPISLVKSHLSGSFTDGGAYSGVLSGKADTVSGYIYALYINPEGTELGIIKGDFIGAFDGIDAWNATGTLYPTVYSTDLGSITSDDAFLTKIDDSGYLEIDRLIGDFSGGSGVSIKAHGFGNTSHITGYDWGIFDLMFGYGEYDEATVSDTWAASISGFGEFGDDDEGMWKADITGSSWLTGEIAGQVSGEFLTMTKAGTIEGYLIGPAGSGGDWTAVSQGTWETTSDLQFSSRLDGGMYSIRKEEGGNYYMSTDASWYTYHYDLVTHEGGYQFYDSTNDTNSYMQVHAWGFDGTLADFHSEKYVYDNTSNELISYSAGTFEDPLQNFREDPTAYTGITWDYHDQWTNYNMYHSGWFEGILGGIDSPWAATSASRANITLLGFYEAPFYISPGDPVIFANKIEIYNFDNTTGSYSGFLGGMLTSSINGDIFAIYVDPGNNAGVLLGEFTGTADNTAGIWKAGGGVFPVQLYSSTGVTPASLLSNVECKSYYLWDDSFNGGDDGYFYDGSGAEIGYIDVGGGDFFSKNISGESWGVWQNVVGGSYSGTTGTDWTYGIRQEMWDEFDNVSGMIGTYAVSGGSWSGGQIDADTLGAWIDLDDVVVGVSSGKISGTYDSTEMTWQTYGSGVWIQAGQFIDMTTTSAGQATLTELNMPAFEIGRTDLSGTGSMMSVTMNDVTFFAPSTGEDFQIWATDNISGTFSDAPYIGDYIYLSNSDNSVKADFTLKKWDNYNWAANISNGSGTIIRTDTGTADVVFNGVAGGAYTGTTSGTFSGEGAGTKGPGTDAATTTTPTMMVGGKIMGITSGSHYEGEYILPRSTDPYQTMYSGRIEAGIYEYDYFVADSDGSYLRGFSEEETTDEVTGVTTWTMNDYLPDGTLFTETGTEGGFSPVITEGIWDQTTIASIATPPTGYYMRYTNDFAASMITGIGNFTGGIQVPSELWTSTQAAPLDISISGQYTSSGGPMSLVKSDFAGSFTDGGTYSGFLGGKADSAAGFIHALYINPEGTELGVIEGDFSGAFDGINAWSATGTMYPTVYSTNPGTIANNNFLENIGYGYLEVERLTGDFSGGSGVSIKAHGFGDTSYIMGNDWGIFDLVFGYGEYDEATAADTWAASISGFGEFGGNDKGMWKADITGSSWLTGEVSGQVSGEFLTMTKYGTIEGDLIGPAGSGGDWTAVSQGAWQSTSNLQFSSRLDGGIYSISTEEGGNYYMSTNESRYSYHYDLERDQGGYHFYDSVSDTNIYVQVNRWDYDGTVTDFQREEYVYNNLSSALVSYSSTTETTFDLTTFADATANTGLTWDNSDPTWTNYNMYHSGWFEGILGGLDSPWAATSISQANITLLGFYEIPFYISPGQPVIFANNMESFNPYNESFTTFDGGAYTGYIGGTLSSTIDGNIYAIYIDPGNNAGVLIGEFLGSAESISGSWDADGGVYPVQLYASIGVTPDNLLSEVIYKDYFFWNNSSFGDDGYFYDGGGSEIGFIEVGGGEFYSKNIDGEPWGVWQSAEGGAYTGTPGPDWTFRLNHEMWDEFDNVSGMIGKYGVSGGTWSGNQIEADVLGAWVDLDDVVVGVSSGKIAGTYDPTEMTWQTYGSGVWIKAGQYIEMAATSAGQATLADLNMPAFEIGRTDLSGTGSTMSVTMTDVTFFAPATGEAPQVWATNNITGTYTGTPYVGDYVNMANGDYTVTADFNLKKWDNNNWAADISNGNGTITRTDIGGTVDVEFGGVAGGTYTGTTSGTFSGEGAGTVR